MNARDRSVPRVLVIGVGNDYRGDDALGLEAARRLSERRLPGVLVVERSGEGAELMETWKDVPAVVLIDAVSSGVAPGTIHRLEAHAQHVPAKFFHYSTHAFSVAEAIELARVLNRLPPRMIVCGVEGKNFQAKSGLSEEVQKSLPVLLDRVVEDIQTALI